LMIALMAAMKSAKLLPFSSMSAFRALKESWLPA
jgi:hypothetical protein